MMRSTGIGTCAGCGRPYGVGDHVEQDGMDDMGTPKQRWRILHEACAKRRRANPYRLSGSEGDER